TQHGALQFVSVFNPEGVKLKQARLFFNKYEGVLAQAGKLTELEVAVQKEFSRPIREIIGGEQK
ncbi:unnamed protein product, partial [marine sediment metagenome]